MGTPKERQPVAQAPCGCSRLGAPAWPGYQALVRTNPIIVVPVGSIEPHGPHLPLNTDTVIAQALAERLAEEGVDELGMNLELWSGAPWAEFIRGRIELIARERTFATLEYAVQLFEPTHTITIFVVGLERLSRTLSGVEAVVRLGVMPILSPFRPLTWTLLEEVTGSSVDEYVDLFRRCQAFTQWTGVPQGPICVCCLSNTLTLPFGP